MTFITLNYNTSTTFHTILNELSNLCKEICKENFNIKLVLTSFKIKNYFYYKDPIPDDFKSFLVYKFTCARYSFSYVGHTCRHFKTRIGEHIRKDSNSHIFKRPQSIKTCFDSYYSPFLKIIEKVNSQYHLKIKEPSHIDWKKLNLNARRNHLALTFSPYLFSHLFFSVFVFFLRFFFI